MILPEPGFHDALRRLTRDAGTLLIIDETHTISTGPGGSPKPTAWNLTSSSWGKAIAGGDAGRGLGVSPANSRRGLDAAQARIGPGQSGIGTTLSGTAALAMAAMRAMPTEVMTDAAYARMLAGAERLVAMATGA
ncbi:hypothetical protein ACRAWD_01885 [Caulobacter segnis]